MNKFIVYIFGFFLLVQANALACNFKTTNFGSPKESIKIEELIPCQYLTVLEESN